MSSLSEILHEDAQSCTIRRSPRVCAFFNRHAIFFNHDEMTPDDHYPIVLLKEAVIEAYSLRSGNIAGSMGAFSYVYTERDMWQVPVGRYCSIGSDITVFGERHPLEWVTTSNITYAFDGAHPKPLFARAHQELGTGWTALEPPSAGPAPIVEHDVWIGQGAYLARDIIIGTGAVIGAGAVVTRSVEPYMIVAGNPARPIRGRFDDRIAERLLASRWWNAHPDCLFAFNRDDPARFLDQLDAGREAGTVVDAPIPRFTFDQIVAAIQDM